MIKESVNISDLTGIDDDVKKVFGVIVDDFATDINNNLEEVSIKAVDNGDGDLDIDVIDSILAYVTANVHVTLEIPYDSGFSPSNIVILASSSRFDISILPPDSINDGEDIVSQYVDKILEYVDCWISNPMSQADIIPFSNYFSYLITRELGHKPSSLSTDDYINSRFVDHLSHEASELIKEKLYNYIVTHFEGEEEFRSYAHTLGYVIYEFAEGEISLIREAMEEDQSGGDGDQPGGEEASTESGTDSEHK